MIRCQEDIDRGLAELLGLDPRLQKVVDIAGAVPLRKGEPGLRGLMATIIGQQVSRASAAAIFARFAAAMDLEDPAAILAASPDAFRAAGLSRAKHRTVLGIAEAALEGRLDLARIARAPPAEAVAELSALRGIGAWTAECYLLFGLGHPDVFPAGDLALQVAVGHAFAMAGRPGEKALAALSRDWSPHRSVAARLFWSYYHAITRRDAAPVELQSGTMQALESAARPSVAGPDLGAGTASQRRHDRTP